MSFEIHVSGHVKDVVDQTLPDDDGFAAAAALRALYPKADLTVLLTSVAGAVPGREALEAAGIRSFAVKPLRRQTLHDRALAAAEADECYQALKLVRRVMRHEEVVLGIAPATGGVTED